MKTTMPLSEYAQAHFLGSRYSARQLREELALMLKEHHEITIDFKDMSVTQSFIDELLGMLILKDGSELLKRLVLKSCSKDTKEIVKLVINLRLEDYERIHQH